MPQMIFFVVFEGGERRVVVGFIMGGGGGGGALIEEGLSALGTDEPVCEDAAFGTLIFAVGANLT